MAHKKQAAAVGRYDKRIGKRRGIKKFGGEQVIPGNIIVRQLGTKYHPGEGVGMGKDFTLYALTTGKVFFKKKAANRMYVSILAS